jgi:hypothetical protein
MKQVCNKPCLTMSIVLALAFASMASAAQVTDYLRPLQAAVTNRLSDTNLAGAQERALKSANKILGRNAKKVQTELVLLSSAAKTLNARFDDDFLADENTALGEYLDDAERQLSHLELVIGTNAVSRKLSNNLAKAAASLDSAGDTSNRIPVRARAVSKSLKPLSDASKEVIRTLGLAPASLAGWATLDLVENAVVHDQTIYYFTVHNETYLSHHPEELGLWTYQRTGSNSATVTVMPNYPSNDVPRDFKLTFTNVSSGTFTGTNQIRELIQGGFFLGQ